MSEPMVSQKMIMLLKSSNSSLPRGYLSVNSPKVKPSGTVRQKLLALLIGSDRKISMILSRISRSARLGDLRTRRV